MTKYQKGKIISGVVTGIEDYGIFVNVDGLYSGLIHISEISNGYVKDIDKIANIGETICAKIIDIDEDTCHLKLSVKEINHKPERKKRQKIVETKSGFTPLENNLDKWVNEKIKEINAINKKN